MINLGGAVNRVNTVRRRLEVIGKVGLEAGVAASVALAGPLPAGANHTWGGYHWARTSSPFTLKLGDNVSSAWDSYLATTSSDWSQSTVLDTTIVAGEANSKNCQPTVGRVEVCSGRYGNNGWLGIARVWLSGSHITQGTVRMNDTYFESARYNTPAWRNLVMCQEVGHTFGLDHQDENFNNANLGTCMDYTNDPSSNQHPNQHDYDELVILYSHLDGSSTVINSSLGAQGAGQAGPAGNPGDDPSSWGRAVAFTSDGRARVYELDMGGGRKILTFVSWVPGTQQSSAGREH